ncbi:hypothetical protein J3L18_03880 [Mucilaginibacter gossypii]|uniref:hypothetical protein n=1 Tax=Mucilaginibacter gossypii TaxID=551996 RepID=UPI001019FFA8|nr:MULTISPECIES: hypothetical protein [Mucilaginibacter]QTE38222.1 hypothetical protein J3L18_03880 [Mucilaginibacter gossypii]
MKRHRFAKIVNTDFHVKAESIDNNLFIDSSNGGICPIYGRKKGVLNYKLKDSLLYLKGNVYDEVWKSVK